jgi:hypothetical protein
MTAEEKRQAEILIENDFNHAKDKASKFIVPFLVQLNFRCQSLNLAMLKAVKLLELPPKSSELSHIWDLAFTIISSACPLLGVGKALEESGKAIMVAAALGNNTAKALKVASAGGEWAERINTGKETAEKIATQVQEVRGEPGGMEELTKYDVGKQPLREMLDNANKAIMVWGAALDVLDDEEMFRKLDVEQRVYKPSGSIQQLADRLLPKPLDPMTQDDIDQLELAFLWQIFKGYSLKHFTIVYTLSGRPSAPKRDVYIDGLNDNQQDTLVEMFGPDATRGKTFFMPPAINIYFLLGLWGAPSRQAVPNWSWPSGRNQP